MNKTKCIAIALSMWICAGLSSCKNMPAAKEEKAATPAKEVSNILPAKELLPDSPVVNIIKSDTAQVLSNITDFLRWYKDNYKKANAFPILTKDSADNYIVNHAAYTDYLKFIGGNHFISPAYIGYWKTYFDDKETELKTYPINNVVPEGFDFDIVLITEKPEVILNKIDLLRYKIISMSDSAALVRMKLPHNRAVDYEIAMLREKNEWKIEFISSPNYD